MRSLIALIAFLVIPQIVNAEPVATDFDSDSRSDITLVTISGDGSLRWKSAASASGTTLSHPSIGKNGDQLILAHWRGTSAPQLGVITLDSTGESILWKIIDESGQTQQATLGARTDTAISGADFNGNGLADGAAAKLEKGKIVWTLGMDLFGAAPTRSEKTFGTRGDRIFFVNPEGSNDWMAALGKTRKGNRSQLKMVNPVTGETRRSTRFPASFSKGTRPRPVPVQNANGSDILLIVYEKGEGTVADFRGLDGARIAKVVFPGHGVVIVGDFTSDAGEEIAIKTSAGFTIFNPFSNNTSNTASEAGIPVDEVNINFLEAPEAPNDSGGGSGTPSGSELTCTNVINLASSSNVLYKDANLHGGRGRSFLDQDHQFGGARRINVAGTNGNVIACFGLFACDQPYGCRYYQAMCGDTLSNAGFVAAAKANGGTTRVLAGDGGGKCFSFDSTQSRVGSVRK